MGTCVCVREREREREREGERDGLIIAEPWHFQGMDPEGMLT